MVTCLACNYCRKLNLFLLHAPNGKMDMIRVNHHQLHSVSYIVMMPSINTEGSFECKTIFEH